jgi:mannose-1-phosphate guanylyltransferase / mannose-6-phosphate isomerase
MYRMKRWNVFQKRKSGNESMVLIEVHAGIYFGEDDIVKYEDCYSRGKDD